MKRLSRFFIVILTLLFFSVTVNSVSDMDYTLTGGAGYKVLERQQTNDLDFGINHFIDRGETLRGTSKFQQRINVLEIPTNTKAKIITYSDLNDHKWNRTSLTNFAKQFEEENPSWTVLAGINADFFEYRTDHMQYNQPRNALMNDGNYYKTSTLNNFAVGFTNDGSANTLIGQKPTRTTLMKLSVFDENDEIIKDFNIQKINETPGANQTSVYYGTYQNTWNNFVGIDVQVGSNHGFFIENAELALPNTPTDFFGKGVISSTNSMFLNKGQFGIVTNNAEVIEALDIGVKIRTQFEYTGAFTNATAITGFQGHFLKNSQHDTTNYRTDLNARHPRTTVGVRADGTIVMAVIDGRQAAHGMEGVFGDEMAAVMKRYGCTDAYNLDGGGSSTMIIRKDGDFVVVNSPSDGGQRFNANALLIAVQVPNINFSFQRTHNSVTINADLLNSYGFDITDLFVYIEGATQRIVNGKTTFIGLNYNTEYYYRIRYRDSKGRLTDLPIDGRVSTLKRTPELHGIEVSEESSVITIKVLYSDPDNASLLRMADIWINDKKYILTNGELYLLANNLDSIDGITISYRYDVNDGEETVTIDNYPFRILSNELDILDNIFNNLEDFIKRIYR